MSKLNRFLALCALPFVTLAAVASDSIPCGLARPLHWSLGVDATASVVPATNDFLRGRNNYNQAAGAAFSPGLRLELRYSPDSREGMLYHGLYQGIGTSANFFEGYKFLGRPVSLFVFQGSPIVHFSRRFWLGYEWQFGAAFGWKHYNEIFNPDNVSLSTSTTAHLGLALTLNYRLSAHTYLTLGLGAKHFSNGNTEWPNAGVNTVGVSLGVTWTPQPYGDKIRPSASLQHQADQGRWMYDILAYGAWRKRVVAIGDNQELVPGHFAVAGIQFSPLRRLNRWVAVGPALDLQWDEGANLQDNRVEGTYGDMMRFYRPSFSSQISAGVSAHAELTMPVFSVNAGLGYDFIKPDGDHRFYQSLSLKAFVWRGVFLNVGYRLCEFKTPQNLMLGLGIRL